MARLQKLYRSMRPTQLVPALLLAGIGAVAGAQTPRIGVRMGYNFDTRDPLISTNVAVPMSGRLEFYPSVDIYLPDRGSMTGFNGDFRLRVPTVSGPDLYFGGGLNVLSRSVDRTSNTDVGADLLMGLESRAGPIRPYAEGRVLLHDRNAFQLIGGISLSLGGS